jgi:hypothetical protein
VSTHTAPRFAAGILAGSLLLGSAFQWVSGASAASTRPKLAFAAGQVSNLSGNTFTLTRTSKKTGKTVTIAVSLAAKAREKARPGTTGALAISDYAVVAGTRTPTGITASRVLYSTTAFKVGRLARHLAAGTYVAAASLGTSLVIKTKQGKDVTFTVTSSTKYRVGGKPATSAPAFTDGERMVVLFKRDKATHTLIAMDIGVK